MVCDLITERFFRVPGLGTKTVLCVFLSFNKIFRLVFRLTQIIKTERKVTMKLVENTKDPSKC